MRQIDSQRKKNYKLMNLIKTTFIALLIFIGRGIIRYKFFSKKKERGRELGKLIHFSV